MLKSVAAAAVNSRVLEQLFKMIAPTYSPNGKLEILLKEFSNLDPDELVDRTAEFLKFIYLRSLWVGEKDGFVPVKKPIDEIWHAFIVQTRDYDRFCQALPGKVFLHHTSIHLEDMAQQQDKFLLVKEMLSWIPRYREYFGPFTLKTAAYWIMPGFLMEALGLSLDEINQLAF